MSPGPRALGAPVPVVHGEDVKVLEHHRADPGSVSPPTGVIGGRARRGPSSFDVATVGLGIGLGVVVGVHGSPGWQLVRTAAVAVVTAAALLTARRVSVRSRAVMAVGSGVVGVVVGVGIGVWHLAHGSVGPVAVAALVDLVAGGWLLGAGTVTLVRRARRWRKLFAVPVAFLLLELVLIPVTTAVVATNPGRTAVGAPTPADRGLQFRDVSFRTGDGIRLSGWYVPSRNGAVVVMLHGASGTRSDVLDQATVVAKHGYGVLLFDARGHGRSDGNGMDFGWYGDLDVRAAVSYVARQPDVEAGRIAVLGSSMGGEEAIGAAAVDDRIRAVVAEGATGRVGDDHPDAGPLEQAMAWIQDRVADVLTGARPPDPLRQAIVEIAPRRLLLIASGAGDEIARDRALRAAAPGSVELWEVPDSGHTHTLAAHPRRWIRRVTAFLEQSLGS